jgi:hypothetical protein
MTQFSVIGNNVDVVAGVPYNLFSLFTVTPGTDPSGSSGIVVAAYIAIIPSASYTITGTTPDTSGYYDFLLYGDPSYFAPAVFPSSGTITFSSDGASATGIVSYDYVPVGGGGVQANHFDTEFPSLGPLPIANVSGPTSPVLEGTNATFTIGLTQKAATPVTINYRTADGSAVAGTDYAAQSGSVTFAPGQTTETVTIPVFYDANVDASENPPDQSGSSETLQLELTSASGAIIGTSSATATIQEVALFTTSADSVDFNNLTSAQQAAIAGGANVYNGLGGSDIVTLPSIANYNVSLASAGGTLNWDPSQTFVTGSQVGNNYTVYGSDGSYKVALGAGSDTVAINGNGSSTITAGSGSSTIDTITINGTGTNTINLGTEAANITLTGSNNNIDFFSANETATLVLPAHFKENISGFTSGDVIDLKGQGDLTLSAVLNYKGVKNPGEVDLWLDGALVGSWFFDSSVDYTELEPLSDGNGGTKIIIDQTPAVRSHPAGYSINWSTIITNEGNDFLEPYTLKGPGAYHSGITIAAGVDLNNLGITQAQFAAALNLTVQQVQANPNLNFLYNEIGSIPNQTKADIASINAQAISDLDAKTVPVLFGNSATQDLLARTISITQAQAIKLDDYAEQVTVDAMEAAWNVTSKDITDLDPSVQTALADVFYNQGKAGRAGVLAAVEAAAATTAAVNTPEWQAAWQSVVDALRLISDSTGRFDRDATAIQNALGLPSVASAPTIEQGTAGSNGVLTVAFATVLNTQYLIDPSGSPIFNLTANPGSPAFSSIQLPTADDIGETYLVSFGNGSTWSAAQSVQPLQFLAVPTGASSIEVTVVDPNSVSASGTSEFGFFVTFASAGNFSGSVTLPLPQTPTLSAASDSGAVASQILSLSNLVSISDPDLVGYQQLELWDSHGTITGGQLVVNGVPQTGGHEIDVSPANVTSTVFDAGTWGGTDMLWARLLQDDGTLTAWTPFTVTVPTPSLSVSSLASATKSQVINLSTLVTIADPGNVGYQQLELWDSSGTASGGRFVVNGVPQTGGHEIDVSPANVAGTVFDVGAAGGTDTLWARLLQSDGQLTSWQEFTVTAPIDTGAAVTLTSSNAILGKGQTSVAASSLFTASDTDGDTVTQYDFWNLGTGGGRFLVNGVAQGTDQQIIVSAAQLSQVTYQPESGGDTLWVQANDGYVWGAWSSPFTVSPWVQTPPAVTVSNLAATHGQSFAAASLFSAGDPDGDTITQYDFWDTGAGGGHFVLNGTTLGVNQDNYVTAAQLAQTTYQSGSGADTLWVRANDGTQWSPWSSAFMVTAPVDTGPVVTPASSNVSATHNQSFAASSLFTYSDPFSDPATGYDLWDTGAGGGHFVLNGTTLGVNQDNYVTAAQLAQTTYQSGSGADTLWVRANDGTQWSPWSSALTVTAPVDTGPVVTPLSSNVSASHNQSFAASSLFVYSDPFNDAATQYDVWDTGTGGGHFVLNGVALGSNQDNFVSASLLAQLTYQSGSGADTLWVRASDGAQWSPWSSAFTVTAPIDTGPVVNSVSNIQTTAGKTFTASSLFTASDPFGDAIEQYDFWDTGSGGGHFALNNQAFDVNQDNIVSAAQLGQTSYVAGSGSDTLRVRVSEGGQWSAWSQAFTVSTDAGPVVSPVSSQLTAQHGENFAAGLLVRVSDPDEAGYAITEFDFWNIGTGGGKFVLSNQALGVGQDNYVSALLDPTGFSQLDRLTYQSGSGTDTLWVRAMDSNSVWGAWSSAFTVTAPIDTGPVVTSVSSITTVAGQTFAASSLFTANDPFGDAISQYDFWDTGAGGGHFALNNQALGANQDNFISAAQLAQTTYVAGTGTDTLWVRVQEGGQWSAWSQSFTVSDPPTIGAGETLELASAFSGTLTFAGSTGTLKIDEAASFAGTVAGRLAPGDMIDLSDITAGANATIGFSGNDSPGTLTVSDGTHTARLALLGQYAAASFAASSDGHGGTAITDPGLIPQLQLVQPHT